MNYPRLILMLALTIIISACGGGGDDNQQNQITPPAVNQAPTVSFGSPSDTSTLSEASVELSANASDADGSVVSATFTVTTAGNSVFENQLIAQPFTTTWDLSEVTDGDYTIMVTVKDNDGAEASVSINVTVEKSVPTPEAPVITGPPFQGTIFLDKNIITSDDQSTFVSAAYEGIASRQMFDRRKNAFLTIDAFIFNAAYEDGRTIEVQVNTEFETSEEAQTEADFYANEIGRLPSVLLKDVETVWIHKGVEPYGGGNNNILIHTGQSKLYIDDGILEETLVHEASHTSLDAEHASSEGWLLAQTEDGNFISTYARDNPTREDIAESFLLYLAIRYRSDRISPELEKTILETMPNRIVYFDNQAFNMYPIQ